MRQSNEPRSQRLPEETIGEVLTRTREVLRAAAIPDAEIEADFLTAHSLGLDTAGLYARSSDPVTNEQASALKRNLNRRLRREPLAYIRGVQAFYGREFLVDKRVLIPRPETELLVERAVAFARRLFETPSSGRREIVGGGMHESPAPTPPPSRGGGPEPLRVADIGTGSGALAVTLALEIPGWDVYAVDASQDALDVATENARRLGAISWIRFFRGELSQPLQGRFQIVVANLPYIRTDALPGLQPEISYEPRQALDGGPDGMTYLGPLIEQMPNLLASPGVALLEIDPPIAAQALQAAMRSCPEANLGVHKDLAGLGRCLEIRLPRADRRI
ncbi:MAG: peptide chain release factor N(5)-glutamine methyltransferase [Chloroflexi bacterium]|nr:peptide chain release factor N(5)-glutamine methyltransferase [Chloroflexota bacterium]